MNRLTQLPITFLLILILGLLFSTCGKNRVKLDVTPDVVLEKMLNNPNINGTHTGENFCWQARVGMDQYIDNFELTKDDKWLEAGIKYYDYLIGRMILDPDGYKSWMGPYGYDESFWQDALVGDAILFTEILDFSVLVLEDEGLKNKYGDKANSYVNIAKKDFIEKWDKRGCWVEDGPYGTYIGFDKFLKSDSLSEWIHAPEVSRAGVSHPFNKQLDVAQVCLRLYRISGDRYYWARAERIFFTLKNHLQYFDNHYCWNYYEPLYPGDVDLEKMETLHGVWVHPWRSGYQAGEVGKIAEAYHYGIVFDKQDMQRIINTNLKVMWNKDLENPGFINSNGLGADGDTVGLASFQRTYGHSDVSKNAGRLWTGLLDFDQTIRDLYEQRYKGSEDSHGYVHYKNTIQKEPPGFKRKYVRDDVKVPLVSFTESKDLCLATVLPHAVPKDGKSIIICKSWNPGELQIDLFSKSDEKLANLYTGNIQKEKTFLITWDGKDPEDKENYFGEYKIRWSINGGYREFPVLIN